MQVGAENRKKLIAAVSLGALALVLAIVEFGGWFGGSTTNAAAPSPSRTVGADPPTRSSGRTSSVSGKKGHSTLASLDPSLRYDLLRASEDTKYEGTGRNIFRVFVEPPPKPITPVVVSNNEVAPQGRPQPPPPPPINLRFYGFATPSAGGAKRIFLSQGEDVFIAKEGDIVDRRYKVLRISPNAVDILDVLSNNRQSIPLIQG